MELILWNLVKLPLWPNKWSIIVNVLCMFKKNVFLFILDLRVLHVFRKLYFQLIHIHAIFISV